MIRPRARLPLRHLSVLALSLPATGCGAGWHQVAQPWPATFAARQQVQVWAGPETLRLHGVALTADSISGIPFMRPLTCDSCRVTRSRSEVDSLRTGDPAGGFWGSTGLVLLGLFVGALTLCIVGGEDCSPFVGGGT
jgi:hypothetical protein